jgi:hypothetical protein
MIRICTRDLFKKFARFVCGPLDRAGFFAYFGVLRSFSPVRNRTAVGGLSWEGGPRERESD